MNKDVIVNYEILEKISALYGDSFYLLNQKAFERNYSELLNSFLELYNNTRIAYSYKTNYTPKLCRIIDSLGGFAEVVSSMEYDLALKLGVDASKIIVNGPYKKKSELERYLLSGSIVNVDSIIELHYVKEIAEDRPDCYFKYGVRCNFDIGNGLVSRFGIDINDHSSLSAIQAMNIIPNLELQGIHCHYPDRDLSSYANRVDEIIKIADILFVKPPKYIDIGGGFFGHMDDRLKVNFKNHCSYSDYANVIASKFNEKYGEYNDSEKPILFIEPGSALVADTMKFICKVTCIKEVRDKSIAMTSGSKFNLGLFSSSINMPMDVYHCHDDGTIFNDIDISGFTCIESDYLFCGYAGSLNVGDFLSFSNVGSYSIVFKPPFILPNVPILNVFDGNIELIKRKETTEDIFNTFI